MAQAQLNQRLQQMISTNKPSSERKSNQMEVIIKSESGERFNAADDQSDMALDEPVLIDNFPAVPISRRLATISSEVQLEEGNLEAENVEDIYDKFKKAIINQQNKSIKEELSTLKAELARVEAHNKNLKDQLSKLKNREEGNRMKFEKAHETLKKSEEDNGTLKFQLNKLSSTLNGSIKTSIKDKLDLTAQLFVGNRKIQTFQESIKAHLQEINLLGVEISSLKRNLLESKKETEIIKNDFEKKVGRLKTRLERTEKEKEELLRTLQIQNDQDKVDQLSALQSEMIKNQEERKKLEDELFQEKVEHQSCKFRAESYLAEQKKRIIAEIKHEEFNDEKSNLMEPLLPSMDLESSTSPTPDMDQSAEGNGAHNDKRRSSRLNEISKLKQKRKPSFICHYSNCDFKKPLENKTLLRAHVALHIKNKKRAIHLHQGFNETCPDCGKEFRYKRTLKEHQNNHKGIKPHKCPDCDYATPFKVNLTHHQRNSGTCKRRRHNCQN